MGSFIKMCLTPGARRLCTATMQRIFRCGRRVGALDIYLFLQAENSSPGGSIVDTACAVACARVCVIKPKIAVHCKYTSGEC